MKFMFPNKFNVYLHDTPSRELFAKSSRDFSSGCIRIERPLDLALFLLSEDQEWSLEKLKTLLADQKEQTVKLPQAVPVHIQYWTAWVEDGGSVSFRKDLYGRDNRVADALREPPPATER
jgi:murein L,D-transpeptidase YcbB/YkuD